jgi:hypothetical protein
VQHNIKITSDTLNLTTKGILQINQLIPHDPFIREHAFRINIHHEATVLGNPPVQANANKTRTIEGKDPSTFRRAPNGKNPPIIPNGWRKAPITKRVPPQIMTNGIRYRAQFSFLNQKTIQMISRDKLSNLIFLDPTP